MPLPPSRICCRKIDNNDIDSIVNLLTKGFPSSSRDFWLRAVQRLSRHPTPVDFPKYGYLLESAGRPVGVILLIFSSTPVNGKMGIRCNVSSWYVEPGFRTYAAMLVSQALKCKDVTYFNVTPGPHTVPILKAQGHVQYCSGRFLAIPALTMRSYGSRVQLVMPDICPDEDLQSYEIELLLTHASYGCISLICSSGNVTHPFVFAPRRMFGLVPFAYLVYCRDLEDFVRFAGPLGRLLACRAAQGGALARGWSIANASPLGVLCIEPPPGFGQVRSIVSRVLASGRAWVSAATFEGRQIIRACVPHGETTPGDITELVNALQYGFRGCGA